jgi:hypothetical protein
MGEERHGTFRGAVHIPLPTAHPSHDNLIQLVDRPVGSLPSQDNANVPGSWKISHICKLVIISSLNRVVNKIKSWAPAYFSLVHKSCIHKFLNECSPPYPSVADLLWHWLETPTSIGTWQITSSCRTDFLLVSVPYISYSMVRRVSILYLACLCWILNVWLNVLYSARKNVEGTETITR